MNCTDLALTFMTESIINTVKSYTCGDLETIPFGVLVNIVNNQELFKKIIMTSVKFNSHFDYRIISKNFVDGNIFIYVPILGLYLLFTNLDNYKSYLSNMNADIVFQQLIPVNREHKFILRCDNGLVKQIKHALDTTDVKCKFDLTHTQILFNKIKVSSHAQEIKLLNKLKTMNVVDESICVPRHADDNRFIEFTLTYKNRDFESVTVDTM